MQHMCQNPMLRLIGHMVLQVLISATTYQRICGRLDELRLPALQKAYALPPDTPVHRRLHHRRPAGLWSSFQMAMSVTRRSASCSMSGPSSQSHTSRELVNPLLTSCSPSIPHVFMPLHTVDLSSPGLSCSAEKANSLLIPGHTDVWRAY